MTEENPGWRLPALEGPADPDGNPTVVYGAPVTVVVEAFDPRSSSEPRREGHERRVVSTATLYCPPSAGFGADDLCIVRGRLYEVDGEPDEWIDMDGLPEGDVIKLRRVEG